MKKERNKSEKEWKSIVADLINSGENKRVYCDSRNLKYHSLRKWYYRLRNKLSNDNYSHDNDIGVLKKIGRATRGRAGSEIRQLTYEPSINFILLKIKESKKILEQEQLAKDVR
jgi:hypothetical protein